MKKLALLGLVLLLFPIVSAAQISSYDIEASIDDSLVHETALVFVDYQGENSIELLLPPSIRNLVSTINDNPVNCEQREILGATKVICPISAGDDYFIKLNYDTTFPIVSLDNKKLFSQDFQFNESVDKFNFRLKLPERAILAEPVEQFISPQPDKIYSDGRRIILSYELVNISSFDVSVIYEPPKGTPATVLFATFFLVLIVIGLFLTRLGSKKSGEKNLAAEERPKEIEQKEIAEEKKEEKLYLLPDEKVVAEILKSEGKPIRQRDIEKQVEFSKAKLSRVLRGLEERGIIKRIPRGNTNLVELIKK